MRKQSPVEKADSEEPPNSSPVREDFAKEQAAKTLGPVPNLEEHVHQDWWKDIFNALYLKTDGDVVDDPKITHKEIDVFSNLLHLTPQERILDMACGQGRHVLELARRGFKNVEGIDQSHFLIEKAKKDAEKENLFVTFKEGDARQLPYPADTFDVVMILGNSFGYFENARDDLMVLRDVARVLKPSGRILLDITNGDYIRKNFQARTWEWIDKEYFVCRERSLSSDGSRLISREVITQTNKGVIADQFYAERLYSQEGMTQLLTEAGFNGICANCEISPDSQRNQDLGMMANRILFTATLHKEWTPVNGKKHEQVKNVVVLLGDPSINDVVKPDGTFDDDDIYTIDQMKNALHEIPGRHFSYLDHHSTLMADIRALASKIDYVLNLCDEGLFNEARNELHVPALLDIFHIPYTGSGPQCLAYCFDKSLVRGVAREMGIPVPAACWIEPDQTDIQLGCDFPVILKPNFADSSFGITAKNVAHTLEELLAAVKDVREKFGYNRQFIVEEYLTGKDLSIGIIGNPPNHIVLPFNEDTYNIPADLPQICGYEAKWDPKSPYWDGVKSVQGEVLEDTKKIMIDASVRMFTRLECQDYARFDWRLNGKGEPKLLEVNPNPGWCWDGHLAKMAKYAGYSYSDMLRLILEAAEKRIGI
jgi:D-alanine-D-alanine ligase